MLIRAWYRIGTRGATAGWVDEIRRFAGLEVELVEVRETARRQLDACHQANAQALVDGATGGAASSEARRRLRHVALINGAAGASARKEGIAIGCLQALVDPAAAGTAGAVGSPGTELEFAL